MASRLLRLLPATLLVAAAVAFCASGAAAKLTPADLATHGHAWRAAAARHPLQAVSVYVAAFAVLAATGLPVAMVLTALAGVMFGPLFGGLAAMAGAALAALLGYGAARWLVDEPLAARLARRWPRLGAVGRRLRQGGFWPVMGARLFPAMPFAVVNLAAGAARLRPGVFLTASLLGGLPSAFIYAALGSGLADQGARLSLRDASAAPMVWLPLLGLSVLSLLPLMLTRKRAPFP